MDDDEKELGMNDDLVQSKPDPKSIQDFEQDDDVSRAADSKRAVEASKGNYDFDEDKYIHKAPRDMKTGFFIDPEATKNANGRFKFWYCMDMDAYDPVDMVSSITRLKSSNLMTKHPEANTIWNQFLDFGAFVTHMSRDEFQDVVEDPEALEKWAKQLGRGIDAMKTFKVTEEKDDSLSSPVNSGLQPDDSATSASAIKVTEADSELKSRASSNDKEKEDVSGPFYFSDVIGDI